ncbi:MAG: metallophosphoesterase [Chitinispirillaceae bacterium]|nr:metallophosphoesterase [Chitinispirillaceae bacterium]
MLFLISLTYAKKPAKPPVANAGSDRTVMDTDLSGNETISLDGSASYDPDGSITSFIWTENGSQIATDETPTVTLNVGIHTITLTVTDNSGSTDDDDVIITVTDQIPTPDANKGPYMVWNGNNTEMTVLWQFGETTSGSIEWGATTSYGNSATTTEYGSDHQHQYTITGLTPGTKYYYNVAGAGSGSFTAAPPSDAQNVKIFAYGDTRTNPNYHNDVCAGMITSYTDDPAKQTIAILSGDWVLYGNSESAWADEFFPRNYTNLIKFQSEVPLCGPMGNHENFTGNLLNKYFPQPGGENYYYSMDYGPVHIVVVNQYADYDPSSAQYAWLVDDLSFTDKTWKIMTFHEPAWTEGDHGNSTQAQLYLHPLCVQYGVDFVVAGHNHIYVHAVEEGVHHITAGGGGAPLVSGTPYTSDNIVESSINFHFCELDIQGSLLTFTAKLPNGNVIETFQVTRTPEEPTIALTAPAAGAELVMGESTTLTAAIDDAGGTCTKVSFYADYGSGPEFIGEDLNEPWALSWTPSVAGLNVILTATAIVGEATPTSDSIIVNITDPDNIAPVADAGDDRTILDDGDGTESVNLDGSGSEDSDGSIIDYTWKEGSVTLGSSTEPVLYNQQFILGVHTVTLEVMDNGGKTATDQVAINIQPSDNQEPLAEAGPDQNVVDADGDLTETVTLDASGSYDPDGSIIKYEWDVDGDGAYDIIKDAGETSADYAFGLGNHVVTLRVTDNNNATHTDNVSINILENGQLSVVSVRVASDNDDAEEDLSGEGSYSDIGDIDLTSSDLELGRDDQLIRDQLVAVRFIGCNIPNNSTIISAYIQFTCDETGSDPTSVVIHGEAADNAAIYTSTAYDISSRAVTAESVAWNIPAWNTPDVATENERTPNLSTVVQEIVSRAGFSESSAIAFIISGTGRRTAESYDGAAANAPMLHVEYAINGSPNIPPACELYAPSDGATYTAPAAVTIGAVATDEDGGIDRVEFRANGVAVGEDMAAPYVLEWSDVAAGTYDLTAVAFDNVGASTASDTVSITVSLPAGTYTVDQSVGSSLGDVEEEVGEGTVHDASTDLELVNDSNYGDQIIGVRFTGCTIPAGATINNAYIQFTCDETGSDATTVSLRGEAADDASPFTTDNSNVSARSVTDAAVSWTIPAWTTAGASGIDERTPELTAIVQEIVDRSGYTAASSLVFIITGSGRRTAEAYDGSSSAAPKLHVEFTTGGTQNQPPVANAGPDQTVTDSDDNGGEDLFLDGSASYDPDGSITDYTWTENDITIGTGVNPFVAFAVGTHTVTLTVTDNDGTTHSDEVVITVEAASNVPPVANAGPDQTVTDVDDNGSEAVTLDGSGSTDSDGTITDYRWTEGGSPIANGATPTVTFAVGGHTVTHTVTDNEGATQSDEVAILVEAAPNVPPVANAGPDQTVTDTDDDGSEAVTLDGSGSSDSDGSITDYLWREAGSYLASGMTPTVNFTVGTHTVTLTVIDNKGASHNDDVVITVEAAPNITPTCIIDAPENDASFTAPANVTVYVTATDNDGSIANVELKVNGASAGNDATAPYSFNLTSLAAGTYSLQAIATDDSGATTASAIVNITVSEVGSSMHVDNIQVNAIEVNKNKATAEALVTIVDKSGAAVSGATVTVEFTGDVTVTKSGVTDTNGQVTIRASLVKPPCEATGCVSDVTHASYSYDPGANVVTCDNNY